MLALAAMPDRRPREKLDTIHLQMALAEQQRNTAAIELLEIWRAQTIEARTYKAENNIPDAPNEIEEAIADIKTYTAPEVKQDYATNHSPRKIKVNSFLSLNSFVLTLVPRPTSFVPLSQNNC